MKDSATFAADSDLVAAVVPSPNRGARRGAGRPDLLLLHYTGMESAEAALARLTDPTAEVSAHYLVGEDGRVTQLVPERERAWHAGAGSWAGDPDINSCSIGIEIVNGGHDRGCPAYPAVQIDAVARLSREIVRRWSIPPERVLAHSDVAPGRKEDPGEHFPWAELHARGVGHWVEPAAIADEDDTDDGVPAAELRAMLARYGYGLTDVDDDATASAVRAFQRHFRPARVDGRADASTVSTLRALLTRRPGR